MSYCALLYHVVFATREREPWLGAEIRPRVHAYLAGAIRDEGGKALIVGGVADHVHILAKLRQDKAVSKVIGEVKANSSGWMSRTFPEIGGFAWQEGYGAFSVSQSQVQRVYRYIATQEEHHRRVPFAEEFRRLLEAHEIEFDPRYLA